MNVSDFFTYLTGSEATRELGTALAEVLGVGRSPAGERSAAPARP
jgi:hypothetical protein